jgi:hypothetical protein
LPWSRMVVVPFWKALSRHHHIPGNYRVKDVWNSPCSYTTRRKRVECYNYRGATAYEKIIFL